MRIGDREIGPDHPPWLVAELSANHAGSLDRAIALVKAAAAAGADAVKIQTYTPDTMTIDAPQPWFRIGQGTVWEGRTLYDLYAEAQTPWEWHADLMHAAHDAGIAFFSTPFDASAVDFLETLGVPAYKIASFELVDIPLLRRVAGTGKPVILSTGMATEDEILESLATLESGGAGDVALLVCTSAYPATAADMNLRRIRRLGALTGRVIGLSDHSLEAAVPAAAVGLGACIVEKHFTLSRKDGGPDSTFSLEPAELARLANDVRVAWQALGSPAVGTADAEKASQVFRRSLFVVRDMAAGEPFTPDNVRAIRPGIGLHPRHLEQILRARAAGPIPRGTPMRWELTDMGGAGHTD